MTKQTNKIGVLLVNLGTPNSPKTKDVRIYLREFLMDGRVIDIPFLSRFALVNFIIAPFRAPKSAHEYQKLWTAKGSPLMFHGVEVRNLLAAELGENFEVALAMRYQNPSIASAIENLLSKNVSEIIVLPLFPQYASATTGSVHEEVMRILAKKLIIPKLTMISSYHSHPSMIETFAKIGREFMDKEKYDHFVFTFHGLPERHLKKENKTCLTNNCCENFGAHNQLCYRAQCFQTAQKLAAALGLSKDDYTFCFQSRLGRDPWIQPYTEDKVGELAQKGFKNVLVFTPAFVADCLETIVEVGETYKEMFEEKSGGGHWTLAPSLNAHPLWIQTLTQIIREEC